MFLISSAVAIIIAFAAYNVLTSTGMDTASVYSSDNVRLTAKGSQSLILVRRILTIWFAGWIKHTIFKKQPTGRRRCSGVWMVLLIGLAISPLGGLSFRRIFTYHMSPSSRQVIYHFPITIKSPVKTGSERGVYLTKSHHILCANAPTKTVQKFAVIL